ARAAHFTSRSRRVLDPQPANLWDVVRSGGVFFAQEGVYRVLRALRDAVDLRAAVARARFTCGLFLRRAPRPCGARDRARFDCDPRKVSTMTKFATSRRAASAFAPVLFASVSLLLAACSGRIEADLDVMGAAGTTSSQLRSEERRGGEEGGDGECGGG